MRHGLSLEWECGVGGFAAAKLEDIRYEIVVVAIYRTARSVEEYVER